jgi:hypothetical protein
MTAIAIILGVCLAVAIALAVIGWWESEKVHATLAAARLEHSADLRAEQERWAEQLRERVTAYELMLKADGERHERELARMQQMYDRLVQTQATATQDAIRLATTGNAQPQVALVEEREVDAHTRLSRVVSEQAIAHGVGVLRESYRALGIQYSDDDLREEAMLLLSVGTVPEYPREPQQVGVPEAARS